MHPLVSFVVPCFKMAHLLPQCINSILAQDYENFEVLIMDNCSPDHTPEVAQSFNDPRIRYIRNETNLGHIRNFNKGIKLTRGKYVWAVMADDMLKSSRVLGRFVEVMEQTSSIGFVFCRSVELHGGKETGVGQWADWGDRDRIWNGRTFFLRLIEGNRVVASSVFVRRECYPKGGPYQLELPFVADWYIWCLISMNHDVAYLAEPMVCCRFHEDSLTSLYSRDYARICVGDELSCLQRVGHEAGLAGLSFLRRACEAALIRRAVRLLSAGLRNEQPGISRADFEVILKDRVTNSEAKNEIQASVYTDLADEQFWRGQHAQATQSYSLALSARPRHLKTLVKYLLLRTGVPGIRVRHMFHRHWPRNAGVKYAK